MIDARDVTVIAGGRAIVDGVDLRIERGELVALVGANGAGKTTLLRVLTAELSPARGRVLLAGRPLAAWHPLELARVRAVLPQSSPLSFPFRAREVVLFGRAPHGAAAARRIADRALAAAGASHLAERRYPTLSGGEKQRVQLARVLAQIWDAPDRGDCALFLDEPTASLDLAHQHAVLAAARDLADRGAAVLTVLHDLDLAARYADRIAVLARGRVLADASPELALRPDIVERAFSVRASLLRDPDSGCPLIVTRPIARGTTP